MAALGVASVALAGSPARAEAITVTLKTSQFRSMSIPPLSRSRPVRQRQVRDGYVRLLRRAETVCRVAAREGRSRRQPAVTGSQTQVKRFNNDRSRLNVLLRRLRLPAAPKIRDFSQLGKAVDRQATAPPPRIEDRVRHTDRGQTGLQVRLTSSPPAALPHRGRARRTFVASLVVALGGTGLLAPAAQADPGCQNGGALIMWARGRARRSEHRSSHRSTRTLATRSAAPRIRTSNLATRTATFS